MAYPLTLSSWGWSMRSERLIKDNREWIIEETVSGYRVKYGVIGGKTQCKVRPVKPKGGRTFWQQIDLEINSKINKQRDKGYHLPDEEPPRLILPMLAHPYDPGRAAFPVMVQEKLNGVRCICKCDNQGNINLLTRKGKSITSMDHIRKELGRFMSPGEIWDGEIFNRLFNLQQISGAVRRSRAEGIATDLEYWVYDSIMPGNFRKRDAHLNASLMKPSNIIRKVPSFTCPTQSGIDLYYDSIVDQGGEGIMIRNPEASYQGKRTYDLMKRKGFQDAEFKIVAYDRDVDGLVIWICETEDLRSFEVVPIGSREERSMDNQVALEHLGLMLTVRYSDTSAAGIPQGNPVGICIRDYE